MKGTLAAAALVLLSLQCATVLAQPFAPESGFLPLGNLLTVDNGGPYNFSLLTQQAVEIKAGLAAKQNYTDMDIIDFLVNAECLEGLFDTWGAFGRGFNGDLELGGPVPIGARKANLTMAVQPFMEEVALNEQGHALFTRHAGSALPCPLVDFDGGFNAFMAAAFELPNGTTVEDEFGTPYDPFKNDVNFVLSVLSLEELGATGNKGLIGLTTNPVLANGIAGLATAATGQATVERMLLWGMRDEIVEPFGETAQQVFARVSALRDRLDGPQFTDQGLVNTDPRFIAVPTQYVNMVPTDVRGLTVNRSPQQNINILTLGNPDGVGAFFPEGFLGAINKPTGYDLIASGIVDWPENPAVATQGDPSELGVVPEPEPITAAGPFVVPGEDTLTQDINGPLATPSYLSRGYNLSIVTGEAFFTDEPTVEVADVTTSSAAGRKMLQV